MSIVGLQGVFGLHRQVGANSDINEPNMTAKGPYNAISDASATTTVQTIELSGSPAGSETYRLAFRGQVTDNIACDASAATILGKLEALNNIAPGDVDVTGSAGGPYTVAWDDEGAYAKMPVGVTLYDTNVASTTSVVVHTVATTAGTTNKTGGRWYWLPATSVNFQPQQIVQSIPMEVGGDLWARGSYKGGVHGEGQVMLVPRGGLGLAELFFAFTGNPLVSGTSASDFSAGTINKLAGTGSNGVESGNFKYRFTPQSGSQAQLPWYTLIRNVGGKFVEEFGDARLGNFAFDMSSTNILNIDASFISRHCGTIALGSGASSVGAQKAGNGIPFQAIDAVVKLDSNVNGNPGPVVDNADLLPTRLNIGFANQLSNNEHVVGSYYLQDITNMARTANVTYSVYMKNPDLYARTYAYGADIVNQDSGWSPQIWKGKLYTKMLGGSIGSTSDKFTIEIEIPEMDYMATPISLAGNNLVEYQLTTNVVLSQTAGVYPFSLTYTTNEDII